MKMKRKRKKEFLRIPATQDYGLGVHIDYGERKHEKEYTKKGLKYIRSL